jgi:hypothetical protein
LLFPSTPSAKGNRLVCIPRRNSDQKFIDAALWVKKNVLDGPVRIVSMQSEPQEQQTCQMLAEKFDTTDIRTTATIGELVDACSGAAHIVTERYHGALGGFFLGVPLTVVSQGAGDKLDEFRKLSQAGATPSELRTLATVGEQRLRSVLL